MDPRAGDLTIDLVLDQSVYVRNSLRALQLEGLLGAGFAALVVLLFLGRLRSTVVVLVSLPLAILAAIIGLFFSGSTLNAMTIGGLALVIGILIDQSIVVVEAIVRHVEEGEEPFEAALNGATEVAIPVLVSTVTFCVVFFPITFLSGMASYLFRPVALAATLAMGASFLFAITLVPAFCARTLKRSSGDSGRRSHEMRGITSLYVQLVRVLLRVRWPVLLGAAILFVLSLFLLRETGRELFPSVDAGQFQILVRLPSGTRIERTEARLVEIEKLLIEEMGQPDPWRQERHRMQAPWPWEHRFCLPSPWCPHSVHARSRGVPETRDGGRMR